MKYPSTIILDCDGVLVDWVEGFHAFMEEQGFTLNPAMAHSYNINDRYNGVTSEDSKAQILEFNHSPDILDLKPLPEAINALANLKTVHNYNFVVITSFAENPAAIKNREENLKNVFGESTFSKIVCVPCGAEKDEALQPYLNSGALFIDDRTSNIETALRLGLRPVLFNQPWNARDQVDVFRVSDWIDLYVSIALEVIP